MDFPCFPMSVRVSSRFSSFFPTVACLSHLIFCGFHGQYIKMLSRLERSSMEGVEVTFCCLQMMYYWHHPEWTSNTHLKVLSSGENTCLSWRSLSTLRSYSQWKKACGSVMVTWEFSFLMKLSVYWPVNVPILTCIMSKSRRN